MKQCNMCKQTKDYSLFPKKSSTKDGYYSLCKECKGIKDREYYEKHGDKKKVSAKQYYHDNKEKKQEYYEENKEKIKEYNKNYRQENKEDIKEYNKQYKEEKRQEIKQQRRKFREENREKINEYEKTKLKNDPQYLLAKRIRNRTQEFLKFRNWKRKYAFSQYIKCTPGALVKYIESLWEEGMSWDNYGNDEGQWNLDHIVPLSSAQDSAQMYALSAYTNLRPMWAIDNFRKNNKYDLSPEA